MFSMRKLIIGVTVVVFLLFVWSAWLVRQPGDPHAQKTIGRLGSVFSLKGKPSEFGIQGFKNFEKVPYRKKKELRKARNVWIHSNQTVLGRITIGGFQKKRRKLKDVTVLVKFYIPWDNSAFLTVKGTDLENLEQVQEDIPPAGDGFCTRIVFLGPVNVVELEAKVPGENSHAIVDEFKIAVGSTAFDNIEEVTCQ